MNLVSLFKPVIVEFHSDSGYTKVVYTRLVGLEMSDEIFPYAG